SGAAGLWRSWAASAGAVRARGALGGGATGECLDHHRDPAGRERAARRRSAEAARVGEDRSTPCGTGRGFGGVPREAGGRYVQTRLCSLVRQRGDAVAGVGSSLQRGAPHRAMPEARQGRGGLVALPGSNVARLASSSDLVTPRHLVPDKGSQAGKKYGP